MRPRLGRSDSLEAVCPRAAARRTRAGNGRAIDRARALKARPTDATSVWLLGEARWREGSLSEALELYRFATCLDDKEESLARSYWNAARHLRRDDDALRFLEGRFRRYAARSAQPCGTLYWAFWQLERKPEGFAVLEEAVGLRPEDGSLLLFLAESYAYHGELEKAEARLEGAKGLSRSGEWLRTAAALESLRGDLTKALSLWREVLEAEPWVLDANRSFARLLAETDSRSAALDHLAQACERYPHNYALHQTRIEWLRANGPAAVEAAVRQILELHPADAWCQRELCAGAFATRPPRGGRGRHADCLAARAIKRGRSPHSGRRAGQGRPP